LIMNYKEAEIVKTYSFSVAASTNIFMRDFDRGLFITSAS